MDFNFISTSLFRHNLERLVKNYPSCKKDICNELKPLSLDEIHAKNYRLKDSGNIRIIKIRIGNSQGNGKGKSSGFRVIVIANLRKRHVGLLTIFAKTGKDGLNNIENHELSEAIKEYSRDVREASFKIHNILSELEIIEQEKEKP